ncbi:uncharacterized protein M6B38_145385 [Iris pallida]|uniref:Uncharacterized protein n=1 Tax=Iris pallida TaxID=29817 RepID=A0AAX6FAP9_IRIPA|nr:uncharacterized protein M6B38_145385 [Iris pallida]
MADKSTTRRAPLDRGIEQAIVALKKGAHILKCGRRGKPKFCPFRLSADEKLLIWYSGEKEKQLKLKSVSKIVLGQKTVNFLRQPQPEKDSQSFSLIYQNGERSLDLICKDREQAESWFLGLTALLSASLHPRTLSSLRIGRVAQSCASSPIGHVQRKYKLGPLQDSQKFLQVRSLHGSPPRSLLDRFFSDTALDSSDLFYSSRQRTLSDMQPVLDEMLPSFPRAVSGSLKNTRVSEERRMSSTPKVSSSYHGSLAIDKTDTLKDVFLWGEGISRFLCDGLDTFDNSDYKFDALVPRILQSTGTLEVNKISCGEKHTVLVTRQGEVFSWGQESGGRLGHKMNIDVHCPKVIESLKNVKVQTVACGSHHTCAVTSSGELYSWGDSNYGVESFHNGSNISQWFPHRILRSLEGIHISKVACGEWHTAVVSSHGRLYTYGDGTFGVLGHGNLQSLSQPKEVKALEGFRVKSVACGPWHTAAIIEVVIGRFKSNTPGGKLFTWGDSDKGRLGHADKERKLLPTCVASLVDCDFVQVSCGRTLTVSLTVTGIVFTMGSAVYGQLGNPQAEDISIATVEGSLKSEFVKEISSGAFHVAALTTKGKVYTWGKGDNGRLGLGDTRDRSCPTLVEALEDRHVQSIACGSSFTAATCSHKSVSSKDQSVCSRCQIIFGFTRKKHNCYNCGFGFCHSCSSKKATNASLAPNRGKKYRVCDSCFTQLQELVDSKTTEEFRSPRQPNSRLKGFSDLKVRSEEMFFTRPKIFTPKISSEVDIKSVERKAASSQGRKQHCQEPPKPCLVKTQRWGQVPCPLQFDGHEGGNYTNIDPMSRVEVRGDSHVHAQHHLLVSKSALPKASSLKQDLTEIDKMLSEELQRLHAEAILLAEQCQAKSLKLRHYKRQIEDTWTLARDEAAKCKAAKDVIKILTNQMNSVSAKYSAGTEMNSARFLPDSKSHVATPRPFQRELSEAISGKLTHIHPEDTISMEDTRQNVPKAPRDERVEQEEPGVYITLVALPSGQKGLKRVRFSRKQFSDREAELWWQENQNRVYLKYNIERVVASNKNKIDN